MLATVRFSLPRLYVSTAGNDAWSGTLAEPDAARSDGPLATLDRARVVVRKKIAEGLTRPINVFIRGGEYELGSTIVFGPQDAGTRECPITYRAYPNEKPIFTGAKRLTDWKRCATDPAGTALAAKGKLWMLEIPENLRVSWNIKTLYDGLTLLPRSRSEEFMSSKIELPDDKHDALKALPKGAASSNEQSSGNKHEDLRTMESNLKTTDAPLVFTRDLPYEGSDLNTVSDPRDLEVVIPPRYLWLLNILPLESVDPVKKMARFAVTPTYRPRPRNKYFVENAIEHLDKPGEWIYESKTGRMYLWPKQSLNESDIRAPFLQEFIRVEGIEDKSPASYVNFIGLTFHHGLRDTVTPSDIGLQHDWDMYDKGNAVLRFRHAEDCTVDSCAFTASSGDGVRLDLHCQHVTVKNSLFSHLGGTGVLLSGYGPEFKDENHDNTIANNLFHHVGEIYWQCPAIFIT